MLGVRPLEGGRLLGGFVGERRSALDCIKNMEAPCQTVLRMPRFTVTYELTPFINSFQPVKPISIVSVFDTRAKEYIPAENDPVILARQRKHFIENRSFLNTLVKNYVVKQAKAKAIADARKIETQKKWLSRVNTIEQFRAAGVNLEKQRKEDAMFNKYQYAFDPNRFNKEKATIPPRELGVKTSRTFVPVKDPLAEHEAYKK